jgi:hypothetical protein
MTSLDTIDRDTWYNSEYFSLCCAYSASISFSNLLVTWWSLLPAAIVAIPFAWVLTDHSRDMNKARRKTNAWYCGMSCVPCFSALSSSSPSIPRLIADADALKAPLLEHFDCSVEGAPSLRALEAVARFTTEHHALMDAHTAAWLRCIAAQARRALYANLIGACFYVLSLAMLVPLRLAGIVDAPGAGFIIVNACFASYLTSTVVEHRAGLLALARIRGALVARICTLPQVLLEREKGVSLRKRCMSWVLVSTCSMFCA